MFAGVINQAKAAASGLLLKYVARASVAVLIALGFALAAVTVMLVERFGQVTAYWLLAGGPLRPCPFACQLVAASVFAWPRPRKDYGRGNVLLQAGFRQLDQTFARARAIRFLAAMRTNPLFVR
jgi:hypothetical protein